MTSLDKAAAREQARDKTTGQFGEQPLAEPEPDLLTPPLEQIPEDDGDDEPTVPVPALGEPGEVPAAAPAASGVLRRAGVATVVAVPLAAAAVAFSSGGVPALMQSWPGQAVVVGMAAAAVVGGWLLTKLVDLPDW